MAKLLHKELSSKLSDTDLLVCFALEGDKPNLPPGVVLTRHGLEGFKGEFREARVADCVSGPAKRVLAVGLGKKALLDAERLRRVAAVAVQRAEGAHCVTCTLAVEVALTKQVGAAVLGLAVAEGALLGTYTWQKGKSKPKEPKLQTVTVHGPKDLADSIHNGRVTAEACAFTRDLQNEPANRLTPRDMADQAMGLAKPGRISCAIHDEKAMAKLGMGLLLGVAAGSKEPPRLIHLVYRPKGKAKAKIALVGKGLTFDSGGISIKPAAKMDEMRYDMSGGAAVLGVFHALRSLDVPFEVHGLVGATENMPGNHATKPGDIHIAMDGTTVEVLNTDAEGRLVLADVICYAKDKVKPDTIVDLATLTGAVVTALGHEMAAVFASSEKLERKLREAGDATGERLWPLPLLDVHKDAMKGTFADLKNISGGDLGAGSSAGAAFLAPFVPSGVEWAHLDIAGVAWGGCARDWVGGAMGSGYGARLLLRWLEAE
ncbi:MAG: leucyl aminopeptidase [Planctomycetota bacterium]|mgnify:CR=1 FL=1|nr:leucyl aminopeptidase [Planctomycetota bacterium]